MQVDSPSDWTVIAQMWLPGANYDRLPRIEVYADMRNAGTSRPDVGAMIVDNQRVDEELLRRFPSVRTICRYGIGYDDIDVDLCTRRGIQIGITRGPVEAATAELAIALMLASRRGITSQDAVVRAGGWHEPISVLPHHLGVTGYRLGLVGLGEIGSQVAMRARALGMTVSYHSRGNSPAAPTLGAKRLELDELIGSSDIVSLHVPLTPQTTHLMNAHRLSLMPDGAMLVNTSRGAVVDQDALIVELEKRRIYAGLDVYTDEPLVSERLRSAPNTVLSPHAGSATRSARLEMTRLTLENVLAGLASRPLPNRVREQSSMVVEADAERAQD
jgi:glyoxylate reductase